MAARAIKGSGSVRLLVPDDIEIHCTENKQVQ